jgi:Tol biopolymer transport system component
MPQPHRPVILSLPFGLAALILVGAGGQQPQQPPAPAIVDALMGQALHLDDAEGNCDAAIPLYRRVVDAPGAERPMAARAQFRLAACLERLKRPAARDAYLLVVERFGDQAELAAEARRRAGRLVGAPSKGSGPAPLTLHRASATEFYDASDGLSPDGRYVAWMGNDYNLMVRELASGVDRQLTKTGRRRTKPSDSPGQEYPDATLWAPDSRSIAFTWHNSDGHTDLRLVSLEGSTPRILYADKNAPPSSSGGLADWGPDGRAVLMFVPAKEGCRLVTVSVAEGTTRTLVDRPQCPGSARYSPDGRMLAFNVGFPNDIRNWDIVLLDVVTGIETELIRHPARDSLVGWTPDGGAILFFSDRSDATGLWIQPVSQGRALGEPRLLKSDLGDASPIRLTADGRLFYRVRGRSSEVYVAAIDPKTGEVTQPAEAVGRRPSAANTNPVWSPDGRFLVFMSGTHSTPVVNWADTLTVFDTKSSLERALTTPMLVERLVPAAWPAEAGPIVAGRRPTGATRNPLLRLDPGSGEFSQLQFGGDLNVNPRGIGSDLYAVRAESSTGAKAPGRQALVRQNREKGAETELWIRQGADEVMFAASLAVSPDQRFVALITWVGAPGRDSRLRLIPTAGGEARVLLGPEVRTYYFAWQPDSLAIWCSVVTTESGKSGRPGLWIVPIDGTPARPTAFPAQGTANLTINPDGRRFAFEASSPATSEVWVMEHFLPSSSATVPKANMAPPR